MDANFKLDYAEAISEFERVLKKFNLKKKIFKLLFNSRGLEFEQYRDFNEGEDASMIDWSASSRANKLLAKQYIEEREINFFFVADMSKSMLFGSANKLKAEYSTDVILSLSNIITSSGDNTGLVTFNEEVISYLPPSNLKKQFFAMQESLSKISSYEKSAEFRNVFEFLFNTIKRRNTMVILISDFLHNSQELEKNLRLLSAKCEVIAIAIRDPMDTELPKTTDLLVLSNSQDDSTIVIDSSISQLAYKQVAREQIERVRTVFKNAAVDLLELRTDQPFVIPIINFLQERSRGGENGIVV